MQLSFHRRVSILFTWFVSAISVWICYLFIIAINQAIPTGPPSYYEINSFNRVFILELSVAISIPAILSLAISVWITKKLGNSSDGFNAQENRVYEVLTIFASLFIAVVTLGYFQVPWARLFALGSILGVAIIIWARKGIYLVPGATTSPNSSPPPAQLQQSAPAQSPQSPAVPFDTPKPQS